MARARNNITKLPRPVRWRICELLDDGVEYDAIRADADVAAACAERGLVIHNTSMLAFRQSPEFDEYLKSLRQFSESAERAGVAAYFVKNAGASDDIATVANYELLKIVQAKLAAGEDLETKELSSISGALAAYERNRISAAREDSRREAAAKETEYQAKIAEMAATIANLIDKLSQGNKVDPAAVQDNLDALLGVKK